MSPAPATSLPDFFAAQSDDDGDGDDEAGAADLAESVLDLAAARMPHKRRLRWHYRSQHPALIAFSNREFYDRELVIFPAAAESETAVVRRVQADGIYQANVNPREAEAAIEEARRLMARLKALRGTPLDPFGYSSERKMERALIKQYEADMAEALPKLTDATRDAVIALAELPLQIRGFGPVKAANESKAAKRREEILAAIRQGGAPMSKAAE